MGGGCSGLGRGRLLGLGLSVLESELGMLVRERALVVVVVVVVVVEGNWWLRHSSVRDVCAGYMHLLLLRHLEAVEVECC